MKRLWYVEILKGPETYLVRAANVFDGCEAEESVEAEAADLAQVEAILSCLKPFARLPRRYMEINGLGSLLRIASLPRTPPEELVAHALKDLAAPHPSVLVTSFLAREDVLACARARAAGRKREPGAGGHGRAG